MDLNLTKTTSITKFNVKDKSLYVKLIWKPNDIDLFHIKLFDGDVTWSGKFSYESAKKYGKRCEETEHEYNKNVKRFLKGYSLKEAVYDFERSQEHSNLANFAWKRRYEDSQGYVFLVHGVVPVQLDTNIESKEVIIDFLLEENTDLRATIEHLNVQNEVINKDLIKCKSELETFVDIKTSLEASLYGKFVQLLNAKKRRIQLLESNQPPQVN